MSTITTEPQSGRRGGEAPGVAQVSATGISTTPRFLSAERPGGNPERITSRTSAAPAATPVCVVCEEFVATMGRGV